MSQRATKDSVKANTEEKVKVLDIRGVWKQNLPYIFIWIVYYAWVAVFSTWWNASPLTEAVFGTEQRALIHSINLLSSAVFIFIIQKEWFVKTARMGAVSVFATLILYLVAPNSFVQLIGAILLGISLGCMNTSILMPFVFTLNNTEKLYAVTGSNILINVILLFQERDSSFMQNNYILLSCFILVIALSATLFFEKRSIPIYFDDEVANRPEFHVRIYLTLFFNCIFVILCKGAGKGILNIAASNSNDPILTWYYIGGLIGCVVYVVLYAFSSMAFVWLGNITFGCLAMGLLCNAFIEEIPGMAVAFAIFLGIGSTVGMINMYYIIGVVGKKYNSMRYLRFSILFIGICGGVSGVLLGRLIQQANNFEVSIAASIVSVAVMLLFMTLSPLVVQTHYFDDWAKDSGASEIDNGQHDVFEKYGLSRRETEVCELLLQGYTLRQISGILSIAYSTVNTYCTSLYRKLGINSRTELLLLFKNYVVK